MKKIVLSALLRPSKEGVAAKVAEFPDIKVSAWSIHGAPLRLHTLPPWTVEQIPGGYKVLDANGQSLAYVYGRETKADADTTNVLTRDEARRIVSNIAKLPELLRKP